MLWHHSIDIMDLRQTVVFICVLCAELPVSMLEGQQQHRNIFVFTQFGKTAILRCSSRIVPPATKFSWKFRTSPLTETGRTLEIKPLDDGRTYFGIYSCRATNHLGKSEENLHSFEKVNGCKVTK
ncbi:uncharacterized protein LOC121386907 [Gigantopelta aegis]|uniref:uncharacterized protein LOC121386907 n=1 Tax=Gigantopelta aegis TaxID=1735272 RepID=UPI001B889163|nr:uncharacterized protein LOC121386907 [Gigantopelta aegis]